jgi:hypothetical protein
MLFTLFCISQHSANDGIRVMDLDTVALRMLVSYDELKQFHHRASMDKAILWVSLKKEIRCDLNPRWNRDGATVSIDSVRENERPMYATDVSGIVGR